MADSPCTERDVVLIVDDQEIITEMISELVGIHGCAHVAFTDPAEALRHYREHAKEITLLITDLTMPSMSGPEFVRKALEINPALSTILVANYAGEPMPDDMPRLVSRIVEKPFTQSELLDAVRKALTKADRQDSRS
jgi:DNA-binding NtrC family response regulator